MSEFRFSRSTYGAFLKATRKTAQSSDEYGNKNDRFMNNSEVSDIHNDSSQANNDFYSNEVSGFENSDCPNDFIMDNCVKDNIDNDSEYSEGCFKDEQVEAWRNLFDEASFDEDEREALESRSNELKQILVNPLDVSLQPYDSYNIIDIANSRYHHFRSLDSFGQTKVNDVTLFEGSRIKVDQFKQNLLQFISENNLTEKATQELLDLFRECLPENNNLPQKMKIDSISDLLFLANNDEEIKCFSVIEIENCNCGQTLYIGENLEAQSCGVCGIGRYSMSTDKRYPVSLMNYRSIILIILELLQTKEFYDSIHNVVFEDIKNDCYADVLSADVAKKHLLEMNKKWKQLKPLLKPLNLLLLLQYDGAQIFHWSIKNFWPMLLTILNLPPTLRKEIGVGTFMISLFTAFSKSVCEKFLFYKLLLPELHELYQGIVLEVHGEKYYVQARLILHGYDSKALESVLKVHGANSLVGCSLCRLSPG